MESKVIVITGASSGIGASLARQLSGNGHQVVLAARRKKELEEVAARCAAEHLTVVTDVTRREDMQRLRDVALERFKRHRRVGQQRRQRCGQKGARAV